MYPRHSHMRVSKGFTLLELMITVAIVVIITGIGVSAFSQIFGERLRTESNTLAATIRHAYNRSVAEGLYVRMVLSPGTGVYRVEASAERVLIDPNASQIDTEDEDGESKASSPYTSLMPPVEMEGGVIVSGVITMSQPEEVTDGDAYVHFFPNGFVEPTMIYISDEDGNEYTLIVSPMTGHVTREVGRVDPDGRFGEPDKVEEEGA